jgi:hypothetical protein
MIAGSYADELRFGQEEEHPYCMDLKLSIGQRILELHDQGISDFFSSAEQGTPFYGAEAVIAA